MFDADLFAAQDFAFALDGLDGYDHGQVALDEGVAGRDVALGDFLRVQHHRPAAPYRAGGDDDPALAALLLPAADAVYLDARVQRRVEDRRAVLDEAALFGGLEYDPVPRDAHCQTSLRNFGMKLASRGPTRTSQPVSASSLPDRTAT